MHVTSSLNARAALAQRLAALSAETLARFSESTQALTCISESVMRPVPAPVGGALMAGSAVGCHGKLLRCFFCHLSCSSAHFFLSTSQDSIKLKSTADSASERSSSW
eukprot:1469807-Pyramimonas_sp.AAC.2